MPPIPLHPARLADAPPLSRVLLHALLAASILSTVVFVANWRYGYNMGDEGWGWHLAQLVLEGTLPLRDHFSYDPGRYLWAAAWFAGVGDDGIFWWRLVGAVFGALGLACACASMHLARLPLAVRILVALLLAMALAYPRHKVYEQALSLIGTAGLFVALLRAKPGNWFWLGLLSGLAAILGRNSGLYFCIAAAAGLALHGHRRGMRAVWQGGLAFCSGVIVGYLPMLVWFVRDRAFAEAMIASVRFTSDWQIPLPIPFPWRVRQTLSSLADAQSVATSWLSLATFAVYAFGVAELFRHRHRYLAAEPAALLRAAALFVGIPYLHHGFYRADFGHIAQGILPAFVYLATWLRGGGRPRLAWSAAAVWALLCVCAWLPNLPRVSAWNANRLAPGSMIERELGGSRLVVDATQARLVAQFAQAMRECAVAREQALAMPYYPGMLPLVGRTSPLWDLYFLYPRDASFQRRQIERLQAAGVKVVLVHTEAAIDQRQELRIGSTNPLLLGYIQDHFQWHSTLVDGGRLYVRDCPAQGGDAAPR